MTYLADLSKYTYSRTQGPKILAFGWLDESQPFLKGSTNPLVTQYLEEVKLDDLFRGWHDCQFCPKTNKIRGNSNGTKFVRALNGYTYAAPAMVVHYIRDHNYWVPQEIQDEILKLIK